MMNQAKILVLHLDKYGMQLLLTLILLNANLFSYQISDWSILFGDSQTEY